MKDFFKAPHHQFFEQQEPHIDPREPHFPEHTMPAFPMNHGIMPVPPRGFEEHPQHHKHPQAELLQHLHQALEGKHFGQLEHGGLPPHGPVDELPMNQPLPTEPSMPHEEWLRLAETNGWVDEAEPIEVATPEPKYSITPNEVVVMIEPPLAPEQINKTPAEMQIIEGEAAALLVAEEPHHQPEAEKQPDEAEAIEAAPAEGEIPPEELSIQPTEEVIPSKFDDENTLPIDPEIAPQEPRIAEDETHRIPEEMIQGKPDNAAIPPVDPAMPHPEFHKPSAEEPNPIGAEPHLPNHEEWMELAKEHGWTDEAQPIDVTVTPHKGEEAFIQPPEEISLPIAPEMPHPEFHRFEDGKINPIGDIEPHFPNPEKEMGRPGGHDWENWEHNAEAIPHERAKHIFADTDAQLPDEFINEHFAHGPLPDNLDAGIFELIDHPQHHPMHTPELFKPMHSGAMQPNDLPAFDELLSDDHLMDEMLPTIEPAGHAHAEPIHAQPFHYDQGMIDGMGHMADLLHPEIG